ncbi:MAG TPA: excinuclease ABC subunit A, partial [Candidatus Eisenbacteria bacterium]|nr:excinuclease ABC subunit A [Candidatus Eisenbacteria bacterium]
ADYMRLLLARVGETWCSRCDAPVPRHSVDSVLEEILAVPNVAVTISTRFEAKEGESAEALAARALSRGFLRARRVGSAEWVRLDEPLAGLISPMDGAGNGASPPAGKTAKAAPKKRGRPKRVLDTGPTSATALGPTADPIEVYVDRLAATPDNRMRLREALELAWRESLGSVQVARESGETLTFFDGRTCARCGKTFPEPRPQLFSFNSPYGACVDCHGFGNILTFTVERVVPDPNKSVLNGALDPWANSWRAHFMPKLVALGKEHGIPLGVPFRTLTKEQQKMLLHGTTGFRGVFPFLEKLKEKAYKSSNRFLVKRYQESVLCETCGGMRLKAEALDVRIGDKNVAEISAMTVGQLRHFMTNLALDPVRSAVAAPILAELRGRLEYLGETGLDYLTLDRPSKTLSGGEAQRIDLANALGGSLSHALYVLDEPTVGLHPRDTERLIRVLKRLRERGNTLLVVEHDPDVIASADWILEMGPGAGHRGGSLLYEGPSQAWPARDEMTQAVEIAAEPKPFYRTGPTEWIEIVGAREHNLKGIDVRFPVGALTGVCGVSGSGKSTLVEEILWRVAARKMGENAPAPGAHKITRGLGQFDKVTLVDQSPVARSSRSNPSTYVKAFDRIRERYARVPLARQRRYTPGTFSFNVKGGRCETCEGAGVTKIEMFFLADLWVPCETCNGRRYRPEIL